MAKIKKKEVLDNAKTTINDILENIEKLPDFESAKIYVCDVETVEQILKLDSDLLPLRTETTRGKAYNINKIVNIINPDTPAYDFSMVRVEKYPYVTNKEKCLKKLPEECEVSANFHRKRISEEIENNDYTDDFKRKLSICTLQMKVTSKKGLLKEIRRRAVTFFYLKRKNPSPF